VLATPSSKLVPASIDDFQNILNGSTGLTITTVAPTVENEADRLEIEAIGESVETEENKTNIQDAGSHSESPNVIVQIDSCPTVPKETVTSSSTTSCSAEAENTSLSHPSEVENMDKIKNDTIINSGLKSANSDNVSPIEKQSNLEISVDNACPANESINSDNSLPGAENDRNISISPMLHDSVDLSFVSDKTQMNPFNHFHILAEELQEQLNSSGNLTELNFKVNLETESEKETDRENDENHLINSFQTSAGSTVINTSNDIVTEILSSETSPTVKEELQSECDDTEQRLQLSNELKTEEAVFLVPECVLMKREDNSKTNRKRTASRYNEDINYNEYINERLLEHHKIGREAKLLKQLPTPKSLYGSALVSKLKQKIQEKIQAAVGTSNEENRIIESENDLINTESCINLSLSFNNDFEYSKQIMVTENKLRPKFYQCKSCAKIFFYAVTLHAHKTNCTGLRKQFHCNFCPLIFKSKSVLCNHRRLHTKKFAKIRHRCDSCGREFIFKATLKRHRQMETCVGPKLKRYKRLPQYFCMECGEGFLNASNLALHQKLHTVDKKLAKSTVEGKQDGSEVQANKMRRYPCRYCNETFIDRRSVSLHETLHTDKEFAAFDQKRRLIQRKHQLLMMMKKQQPESSEKKFGCNVCGRYYPIELLLDMHTRLHHAIS
ncbi:hypothetical protein L9F63_014635, partial [Diploptera punctata]